MSLSSPHPVLGLGASDCLHMCVTSKAPVARTEISAQRSPELDAVAVLGFRCQPVPSSRFECCQGLSSATPIQHPGGCTQARMHEEEEEGEEEEEMWSPGRAHLRHIPMVPAGPHRSDHDREGGLCPDPSS